MKHRSIINEFRLAWTYLQQAISLGVEGFISFSRGVLGFGHPKPVQAVHRFLAQKFATGWREDALVLVSLLIVCMGGAILLRGFPAPVTVQPPALEETQSAAVTAAVDLPEGEVPDLLAKPDPWYPPMLYVPASPPPSEPRSAYSDYAFVAPDPSEEVPVPADLMNQTSDSFITLFGEALSSNWYQADYKMGRDHHYKNDWSRDRVQFTSEGMSLSIVESEAGANHPWVSGEVLKSDKFGYGRYEVVMKPVKGEGLVSSFFTYMGPYFNGPHDEIDIEFLGKNTRAVEFNTFRRGRPRYHKIYELPFDAADEFHLYAIEWRPEKITWFIDGVEVYSTPNGAEHLPKASSMIYMNVWTGHARGWVGRQNFEAGARADYACVSYRQIGEQARSCSDVFQPSERSRFLLSTQHRPSN